MIIKPLKNQLPLFQESELRKPQKPCELLMHIDEFRFGKEFWQVCITQYLVTVKKVTFVDFRERVIKANTYLFQFKEGVSLVLVRQGDYFFAQNDVLGAETLHSDKRKAIIQAILVADYHSKRFQNYISTLQDISAADLQKCDEARDKLLDGMLALARIYEAEPNDDNFELRLWKPAVLSN